MANQRIQDMDAEGLGQILVATFSNDPCDLEDGGYIEDVLSDKYLRSDIKEIIPEVWMKAWDFFNKTIVVEK